MPQTLILTLTLQAHVGRMGSDDFQIDAVHFSVDAAMRSPMLPGMVGPWGVLPCAPVAPVAPMPMRGSG